MANDDLDPPTPQTLRLSETYLTFQGQAELIALRLHELAHGIEARLPLLRGGEHFQWKDLRIRLVGLAKEMDGLGARFARWPRLFKADPDQYLKERSTLYNWFLGSLREAEELLAMTRLPEPSEIRKDPREEP